MSMNKILDLIIGEGFIFIAILLFVLIFGPLVPMQ